MMMQSHMLKFALLIIVAGFHVTVSAGNALETGIEAFERQQYQRAYEHWLPLAQKNHAEAQLFLGVLYRYGLGVRRDPQQSAYWYERSAENGDIDAQNEIALFYELGWGVEQDIWAAAGWYQAVTDRDVCLSVTLPTGRLVVDDKVSR